MAEKRVNVRAIQKHDIEANWLKATGFIPLRGEVIIYEADDEHDYERMKVGDGETSVSELPFALDAISTEDIEEILGSLDESDFAGIASPHMVRVTDADGKAKWEERTHYTEMVDAEILPECDVLIDTENGESTVTTQFVAMPIAGNTYTVYWNGVAYECVAEDVEVPYKYDDQGNPTATTPIHCLGNGAVMGEEFGLAATDDPFFIGVLEPEAVEIMGVPAMVNVLDGATAVMVKITGKVETAHQLDPKYLPDEVAPATPIMLTLAADGTFTSDTPFGTAYEKDELTLVRSIRVVCPADVDVGDNKLNTESYYAASNVSKGTGYLGNVYIRCEFAAFVELGENDQAPAKYELVWSNNAGISIWQELPQLPVVSVNTNKNNTLHYYAQGKRWRVNPNHTVDWDGNGWFAGTVEGAALILASPDGSRWQITVDNTGALATAKL